jgi:hypothetical protein
MGKLSSPAIFGPNHTPKTVKVRTTIARQGLSKARNGTGIEQAQVRKALAQKSFLYALRVFLQLRKSYLYFRISPNVSGFAKCEAFG